MATLWGLRHRHHKAQQHLSLWWPLLLFLLLICPASVAPDTGGELTKNFLEMEELLATGGRAEVFEMERLRDEMKGQKKEEAEDRTTEEREEEEKEEDAEDGMERDMIEGVVILKHGANLNITPTLDPFPEYYNFTVCLLAQFPGGDGTFFHYSVNNTHLKAAKSLTGDLIITANFTVYQFSVTPAPSTWSPLCFGYTASTRQAWAVLDGKLLDIKGQAKSWVKDYILGASLGTPHSYLQTDAWVVGLSVVSGQTVLHDPASATCHSLVTWSGLNTLTWHRHNHVLTTHHPRQELCSPSRHSFWLDTQSNYRQAHRQCQAMGGHLPASHTDITLAPPPHCATHHVSWLAAGHITSPSQGSKPLHCPTLLPNGTTGSRFCLAELPCSACVAPTWLRYTLYGPINLHDRYFFLKITPDGRTSFQGLHGVSFISKKNDSWVLWSLLFRQQWYLTTEAWPVGRQLWQSDLTKAVLTLTVCTPFQFSDYSGHCVPRRSRCDRSIDTADGSDELDCLSREVDSTSRELPLTVEGVTDMSVSIDELTVSNIEITNGATHTTKMALLLHLSWKIQDNQFRDLTDFKVFTCSEFWHPRFLIDNLRGNINPSPSMKQCRVAKRKSEYLDLNDHLMGRALKGDGARITMMMKTDITVGCNYRLYRYPFGSHHCYAIIMVQHFPLMNLVVNAQLKYDGDRDLVNYELVDINLTQSFLAANLTLYLKSQYEYYLLTSFAPSLLMFIISYATFFFPLTAFSDRVMASLTALLVLAALFTQASSSYVHTTYYKLIDLWYAAVILLCFTVVICNVVINAILSSPGYRTVLPLDDSPAKSPVTLGQKRASACNTACLFGLLLVAVFVVGMFTLYANEVV